MIMLATLALSLMTATQGPPPPPPPPPPPTGGAAATRDLPFRPPVGKATISGRIVSDEPTPKPLRRASVMLRSDAYRTGWTFVTDDTGVFTFAGIPAGRYTLTASKPSFVTMSYGALKPGRPGQTLTLAEGQTLSPLTLKLAKGAVITGTVRDDTGAPAQNMNITVMRFVMRGGERAQAIASGNSARTDDRGQYRVFGLPAGDYSVSAGRFIFSDEGKLHRVTPSEVDAALKPSTTSGAPTSARTVEESQPIMAASVFYPGTTIFAEAGTVEVAAGEEKSGIDITLQYVAATNIEGRLLGPDGRAPAATTLTMVEVGAPVQISQPRFARPAAETGAFAFNSVPPGQYVITARATTRPPVTGATPDAPLFARADVTVTGRAMPPLTLTLEDGVTVSGLVRPDAASAGIDPRAVRVGLEPIIGRNDVAIGVQAVAPDANGAFAITGVPPGRYRVTIDTGVSGRAILPKSATLQSADALDDGIQVSGSDLSGLDVTITSLAAEISGSLQDASGRAATDFYVIVFPDDRKFWTMNSRRIKTARPGVDGTFVLRNLPPGNYRIAAVTDVDTNEWFEPAFLSQLVSASAQITLAEGEKKAFPLKLGGG